MNRNLVIPGAVLALVIAADPCLSGSVGTLTTFTAGTAARAAEVNGNFSAVKTAVDGNAQDIAALLSSVNSYRSRITALEGSVATMQSAIDALESKTANIRLVPGALNGVAGPNLVVSGANLHVQNGMGNTYSTNGLGNVIIGLNEAELMPAYADSRYGSHNLVVGIEHRFTKTGGLVAGWMNRISDDFASVSGGAQNTARGLHSSVGGGSGNTAVTVGSSISGGSYNTATGVDSSVSGGLFNNAAGNFSSIGGGRENAATGLYSSVSGGYSNTAGGSYSTVGGGRHRVASLNYADNPPDYDSGWVNIAAASAVQITHNLGGDPGKYLIQIVSANSPAYENIGNNGIGYFSFGTSTYGFTFYLLNSSTVYIGRATNESSDGFRVLIWRGNY